MPSNFVLKTTHDSGGVILINDKNNMDIDRTKDVLEKSLKNNYYYLCREWPYKNLRHRIIAEKMITNTVPNDYKFFMFNGIKVSHVYDMNKGKNEKNRRNEKWKFRGGTGRLKICSYHSYKGWQTPNIILVLDSCGSENIVDIRKNVGNAIFISMSRVKPNSMNGQFSFTCFNYLPEYNFLEKLF